MDPISGKILGVTEKANFFMENLKLNSSPLLIVDILIVAVLFYWVYIFLKETRAMRILYGLVFILLLMAAGRLLNLILLNWILRSLMTMLIVAIPVVFQPELRSALEKLGRTKFIGERTFSREEYSALLDEIISAISILSSKKIGALLVLQRQTGLKEYINNGTSLNASVSAELLLSIFFPKSPLHDGAVIVTGDKIVSAQSILPVTQSYLNARVGTRHKAAVGVTEDSDAVALVVSEETGAVSIAVNGKLDYKIDKEKLKMRLTNLMKQNIKKK